MTRFLTHLIARERQAAPLVKPRPVARFESPTTAFVGEGSPDFAGAPGLEEVNDTRTASQSNLQPNQRPSPTAVDGHAVPSSSTMAMPPTVRLPLDSPQGSPFPVSAPMNPDMNLSPAGARTPIPPEVPRSPRQPLGSLSSPLLSEPSPQSVTPAVPSASSQPPLSPPPSGMAEIHTFERQIVERPMVLPPETPVHEPSRVKPEAETQTRRSPPVSVEPTVAVTPRPLEPSPASVQPTDLPQLRPRAVFPRERPGDAIAAFPVPEPPAATPTVNVTIGRIEIKAHPQAKPSRQTTPAKAPVMTLETYLQMRAGGQL
ncbi:MAG: hypothetical protein F6K42_07065 [Leptolyngbya sp. SIO1D8]|nr:hypothetical protein [Leptolyngbya sp. SIO1D8]